MITVKNLTKVYENKTLALKNISFSIQSKGIFALIGRNGAGKTTLLRILATELLPSSGYAEIDGIDIIKDPWTVRKRISVIPQEARVIPWLTPKQTITSYLMYRGLSISEAKRRAEENLKRLGIESYANKLNRVLSGGLKRKVLVATVISSEADILFLDEPTTGLDPISRNELWEILSEIKRERFIFLTTHYLEEAERLADNLAILEKGELAGMGTMDDLRSKFSRKYSIRILDNTSISFDYGEIVKGYDNKIQILADEREAEIITRELIDKKIKFSYNPISLEDIFYYLVKKPIEEED